MRSRRDKKRARERDRNKRSRKYGQIKRKHSRKGIWSCVMAVLVTAVIAGLIVMAFMNKGKSAVAGDMSRELVDILYQHNLIVCHSGSADTFTDFNFNTGRFALERTKDEPAFSHQIKTNPVDIQKLITEKGRCICQI